MNRKTKNIIFYIVVGIFAFIFVSMFVIAIIASLSGSGTTIYQSLLKVVGWLGTNFISATPYIGLLAGLVLAFMFDRKFNSRIN